MAIVDLIACLSVLKFKNSAPNDKKGLIFDIWLKLYCKSKPAVRTSELKEVLSTSLFSFNLPLPTRKVK